MLSIFSDGSFRLDPDRHYFLRIMPDPIPEVYPDARSVCGRAREIDRAFNRVSIHRVIGKGDECLIWLSPPIKPQRRKRKGGM